MLVLKEKDKNTYVERLDRSACLKRKKLYESVVCDWSGEERIVFKPPLVMFTSFPSFMRCIFPNHFGDMPME
jgi:hypothetical protein